MYSSVAFRGHGDPCEKCTLKDAALFHASGFLIYERPVTDSVNSDTLYRLRLVYLISFMGHSKF